MAAAAANRHMPCRWRLAGGATLGGSRVFAILPHLEYRRNTGKNMQCISTTVWHYSSSEATSA